MHDVSSPSKPSGKKKNRTMTKITDVKKFNKAADNIAAPKVGSSVLSLYEAQQIRINP